MGKTLEQLDERLTAWIAEQKLYFVATAPRDGAHVNVSPKGGDTLRILGPREVAYLDLTGSGAETIAHLRENARITVMLCAFEGPPQIVRLYGRGEAHTCGTPGYARLAHLFGQHTGARTIVRIDVKRVQTSCGFQVPYYEFAGERDQLDRWAEAKGRDGVLAYQAERNAVSLDGLPALSP
jgi:hypothetical protein